MFDKADRIIGLIHSFKNEISFYLNMVKLSLLFLFLFFSQDLDAQTPKMQLKQILRNIDPNYKLDNLESMKLKGKLINLDTFQITFLKQLPTNFKSIQYNKTDSIVSIVNESYYYHYKNGSSNKSPRSYLDDDLFVDIFQFDFLYALNQTIDLAEIKIIEETVDFIQISFKTNDEYQIKISTKNELITEYNCECLKFNNQPMVIHLSDYKAFDNVKFPTTIEFWKGEVSLIEKYLIDSIQLNNQQVNNFLIPK